MRKQGLYIPNTNGLGLAIDREFRNHDFLIQGSVDNDVDKPICRIIREKFSEFFYNALKSEDIQVIPHLSDGYAGGQRRYKIVITKADTKYSYYLYVDINPTADKKKYGPAIDGFLLAVDPASVDAFEKGFPAVKKAAPKTPFRSQTSTGVSKKSSNSSGTPRSELNASTSIGAITPENASSKKTSPTVTAGSSFGAASHSALSEAEKIAEAEAEVKRARDQAAVHEKLRAGTDELHKQEALRKAAASRGSEMLREENHAQPEVQMKAAQASAREEIINNYSAASNGIRDKLKLLESQIESLQEEKIEPKKIKKADQRNALILLEKHAVPSEVAERTPRVSVNVERNKDYYDDNNLPERQKILVEKAVEKFNKKRTEALNPTATLDSFIELVEQSKSLKERLSRYDAFFDLTGSDKNKIILELSDIETSKLKRIYLLKKITGQFDAAIKKRAHPHLSACDLSQFNEISGDLLIGYLNSGAKFIRGMDIVGEINLNHFSEKTLSNIDFKNVYFEHAEFNHARFDKSNFKGATFGCVNFNLRMPKRTEINVTIDKVNKKIILDRGGKKIELSSQEDFKKFFEAIDQQYKTQSKKDSFIFKRDLQSRKELQHCKTDFEKLEYLLMDRANQDPNRLTAFAVNKAFEAAVKELEAKSKLAAAVEAPARNEEPVVVETPSEQPYVRPAGFPEGFSKEAVGEYTDIVSWVEGRITNQEHFVFNPRKVIVFNPRNESGEDLNKELRNKVGIALGFIEEKNMYNAGLMMEALIAYYAAQPRSELDLRYDDGGSASIQNAFEKAIQAWVKSAHDSQLEIYVPNQDPVGQHKIAVVAHFCPDIVERVSAEIASRVETKKTQRASFEDKESAARNTIENSRDDSRDDIFSGFSAKKEEIEQREREERKRVTEITVNAEPLRKAIHDAFEQHSMIIDEQHPITITADKIATIISAAQHAFRLGSFLILNETEKESYLTACVNDTTHPLSRLIRTAFDKKKGKPYPADKELEDIIAAQKDAVNEIQKALVTTKAPSSQVKSGLFSKRRSSESSTTPSNEPTTLTPKGKGGK